MNAYAATPIGEWIVSALILIGALFIFFGALGLVRLPDSLCRLHGPSKVGTLGVGALLLASALHFSLTREGLSLHECAILVLLFITAPISAQLLAKAALHRRLPLSPKTQGEAEPQMASERASTSASQADKQGSASDA